MTDMGRPDLDKITEAQPERDLVEQLRLAAHCVQPDYPAEAALCLEAADELAALREQLQYAEMTIAQCENVRARRWRDYARRVRRQREQVRAENERLNMEFDAAATSGEWPWEAERDGLTAKCERLEAWVNDLQAGMYINCVYCGHRYGPDDEVPATMADVLKEHIEQCPEHPLSKVTAKCERLADNLLIRTRELEDRTAERDSARHWHTVTDKDRLEAEDERERLREALEFIKLRSADCGQIASEALAALDKEGGERDE